VSAQRVQRAVDGSEGGGGEAQEWIPLMLMDEMLLAEAPTCMLNRGLRYSVY
jgi:hypothetical protein